MEAIHQARTPGASDATAARIRSDIDVSPSNGALAIDSRGCSAYYSGAQMKRPQGWFLLAFLTSTVIARTSAAPDRDIDALITDVGARVAAYYERAQQLICIERSTVIPIAPDWSMSGFARTVESELRVELPAADGDGLPDPRVTRQIRRINGREPRERDLRDRSGCTDPTPFSPEPLTFLLPAHRGEYRFTSVRDGRERDRAALVIDFASADRSSHPELIEDERGHDDCFDWKGPLAIAGRVWVDAATHDVLRLDRHITGPTEVRVPLRLQRKYQFPTWLTLERDDLNLRYHEIAFNDPDEIALLPESIESVTVFRTRLQSIRTRQVYSNYRRFLTGTRIIEPARTKR